MLTTRARTKRTHAAIRRRGRVCMLPMHAHTLACGVSKPRRDLVGCILNLRTRGIGDWTANGEMSAQNCGGKAGLLACGDEVSRVGACAKRVGGCGAPDVATQHLLRRVKKRALMTVCGRILTRMCTCEGRRRGSVGQKREVCSVQCGGVQREGMRCPKGAGLTWSSEGLHGGLPSGWCERVRPTLRLCGFESGFGDGTIRTSVKIRSRNILGTFYGSHTVAFEGRSKLRPEPG